MAGGKTCITIADRCLSTTSSISRENHLISTVNPVPREQHFAAHAQQNPAISELATASIHSNAGVKKKKPSAEQNAQTRKSYGY